jgi:hypothetical protein
MIVRTYTGLEKALNIKTSAKESLGRYELKQQKPWLDEECLRFLDQRKKTKTQCLRDPNQSNVDDPNNVRHEAKGNLKIKKKEYLKAKIDEHETDSKIKNIRNLRDFKKSYQPRPNIVKDEKGGLVTDSHSILARWRNHFSQLLYVHEFNDFRPTEIHTSDPLVPEPSTFDVETAIKKLRRHK